MENEFDASTLARIVMSPDTAPEDRQAILDAVQKDKNSYNDEYVSATLHAVDKGVLDANNPEHTKATVVDWMERTGNYDKTKPLEEQASVIADGWKMPEPVALPDTSLGGENPLLTAQPKPVQFEQEQKDIFRPAMERIIASMRESQKTDPRLEFPQSMVRDRAVAAKNKQLADQRAEVDRKRLGTNAPKLDMPMDGVEYTPYGSEIQPIDTAKNPGDPRIDQAVGEFQQDALFNSPKYVWAVAKKNLTAPELACAYQLGVSPNLDADIEASAGYLADLSPSKRGMVFSLVQSMRPYEDHAKITQFGESVMDGVIGVGRGVMDWMDERGITPRNWFDNSTSMYEAIQHEFAKDGSPFDDKGDVKPEFADRFNTMMDKYASETGGVWMDPASRDDKLSRLKFEAPFLYADGKKYAAEKSVVREAKGQLVSKELNPISDFAKGTGEMTGFMLGLMAISRIPGIGQGAGVAAMYTSTEAGMVNTLTDYGVDPITAREIALPFAVISSLPASHLIKASTVPEIPLIARYMGSQKYAAVYANALGRYVANVAGNSPMVWADMQVMNGANYAMLATAKAVAEVEGINLDQKMEETLSTAYRQIFEIPSALFFTGSAVRAARGFKSRMKGEGNGALVPKEFQQAFSDTKLTPERWSAAQHTEKMIRSMQENDLPLEDLQTYRKFQDLGRMAPESAEGDSVIPQDKGGGNYDIRSKIETPEGLFDNAQEWLDKKGYGDKAGKMLFEASLAVNEDAAQRRTEAITQYDETVKGARQELDATKPGEVHPKFFEAQQEVSLYGLKLKVFDTNAEAVAANKKLEGKEGMIEGDTVYMVNENIRDPARAVEVLKHEITHKKIKTNPNAPEALNTLRSMLGDETLRGMLPAEYQDLYKDNHNAYADEHLTDVAAMLDTEKARAIIEDRGFMNTLRATVDKVFGYQEVGKLTGKQVLRLAIEIAGTKPEPPPIEAGEEKSATQLPTASEINLKDAVASDKALNKFVDHNVLRGELSGFVQELMASSKQAPATGKQPIENDPGRRAETAVWMDAGKVYPDGFSNASINPIQKFLDGKKLTERQREIVANALKFVAGRAEIDYGARFSIKENELSIRTSDEKEGVRIVDEMISAHKDAPNALHRDGLGDVSLYWGAEGDPARDYKGGSGLAKIIAKRIAEGEDGGAVVRKLIDVILNGDAEPAYGPQNSRQLIKKDGHTAVLLHYRFGEKETWLLTGWVDHEAGGEQGVNPTDSYASAASGLQLQKGAASDVNNDTPSGGKSQDTRWSLSATDQADEFHNNHVKMLSWDIVHGKKTDAATIKKLYTERGLSAPDKMTIDRLLDDAKAAAAETLLKRDDLMDESDLALAISDTVLRQQEVRRRKEIARSFERDGQEYERSRQVVMDTYRRQADLTVTSLRGMSPQDLKKKGVDVQDLLEKLSLDKVPPPDRNPSTSNWQKKPTEAGAEPIDPATGKPIEKPAGMEQDAAIPDAEKDAGGNLNAPLPKPENTVEVDAYLGKMKDVIAQGLIDDGVVRPMALRRVQQTEFFRAQYGRTLEGILRQTVNHINYEFGRDWLNVSIDRLRDTNTVKGIDGAARSILNSANKYRVRETSQKLLNSILETVKFPAKEYRKRSRLQKESRITSGAVERTFDRIQKYVTASPDVVEKRMLEIVDELNKTSTTDEMADMDNTDALKDELSALTRFGSFEFKELSDQKSAAEWLDKKAFDEIAAQEQARELLKKQVAEDRQTLADVSPQRINEGYHKKDESFGISGILMLLHRFEEFTRFAPNGEKKAKAEALVIPIAQDISRASQHKEIRVNQAYLQLGDLVRISYGSKHADLIIRELLKADPELAQFSKYNRALSRAHLIQQLAHLGQDRYRRTAIEMQEIEAKLTSLFGGKPSEIVKRMTTDDLMKALTTHEGDYLIYQNKATGTTLTKGHMEQMLKSIENGGWLARRLENEAGMIKALKPGDMQLVDSLREYYAMNRKELSDSIKDITGLYIEEDDPAYMPASVDAQGYKGFLSESAPRLPVAPASLAARVKHYHDLDEAADVISMFTARANSNAQFMEFGKVHQRINRIFGDKELIRTLELSHGQAWVTGLRRHLLDTMAGEGKKGPRNATLDAVTNFTAVSMLGYNISLVLKQASSLPAFAMYTDTADYLRYTSTAFTPDGLSAMKDIIASDHFQTRWAHTNYAVLYDQFSKLAGTGKRFWDKYSEMGMFFTKAGDASTILVFGSGFYRAKLQEAATKGMIPDQAKTWAMDQLWTLVEITQGSGSVMNRAEWQRRGGSIDRFAGQFLGPQVSYWSKFIHDYRMLAGAMESKDSSLVKEKAVQFAKNVSINWLILPAAYSGMGMLWSWALGQAPDEKSAKRLLITVLSGPTGGMVVTGAMLQSLIEYGVTGKMGLGTELFPGEQVTHTAQTAAAAVSSLAGGDEDEAIKQADRLFAHLFRPYSDVRKAMKNYGE